VKEKAETNPELKKELEKPVWVRDPKVFHRLAWPKEMEGYWSYKWRVADEVCCSKV